MLTQHNVSITNTCLGFNLEQNNPIINHLKPLFLFLLQQYIYQMLHLTDINLHYIINTYMNNNMNVENFCFLAKTLHHLSQFWKVNQ